MLDAALLRALALLAACGASVVLFAQELRGDWLTEFVSANTLSLPNRQRLISSLAVGAALACGLGLVVGLRRNRQALTRLSHLLAPCLWLGLLPPLLRPKAWDPLTAALGIGAFLFLFERTVRVALAAWAAPPSRWSPSRWCRLAEWLAGVRRWAAFLVPTLRRWGAPGLVVFAVIGYAIYMSVFTLWMHGRFQTYGYDLGQYDNIFWSTLHGRPLRCAPLGLIEDWSELRNHAELSVFFLLPLYALRPRADTLLILQSLILALGAIPIYRLASRRLPRAYACVLALAYLAYPPMHGLQFYDFHFQPIAVTFVLLVIDFADERRWVPCGLAFAVALGCREDISVGLAVLGAFLALSGYRVRAGLTMAVTACAYFVLMRFVVMPRFGGWYFEGIYQDLLPEGARNFSGVVGTLLTNPAYVFKSLLSADKLRYVLQILLPLAFLPLRRPFLAVSLVPGSLFTLLTTRYAPTIDIGFQYSAHFIPYIFPAAVAALASYEGAVGLVKRRAALATLVAGTALCGVFWGAIPPRQTIHGGFFDLPMTPPTAADRQKHRDLEELHALVPSGASVAVSEQEMPHVSRIDLFSLRDTTDADFLLYGTASGYYGSDSARAALERGEFEIIAERPSLALARRKAGRRDPTVVPVGSAAGRLPPPAK